jgi:hypothetical protein
MKPFSILVQMCGNSITVTGDNETAGNAGPTTGDSQMRIFSFILAFAFVLAGPSMAGSADQSLPGVGTFAYYGSPVAAAASQPMLVAAK